MRIVSLVPSITEALFDFELDETAIVGRTKFCIHPAEKVESVSVIGGTKNLNIRKIKDLKPDLIIANKEENEKNQIDELTQDFKVWLTDIKNLDDNQKFLTELGEIIGKHELAEKYNKKIADIFADLRYGRPKRAAYLIWANPYMTVGADTFIHDIMSRLGFKNIFEDRKRYPEITVEDLKDAEYVLLSSEPFPFKEKHAAELQLQLPDSKILLVDGEAFSWYGTHLHKCGHYFKSLISTC
ncbi:MAG: helical backbone metal receptor [Weeksellaceae bacterium]|nr:helical backbone metal receptor [Weeksellaceae bacterium]